MRPISLATAFLFATAALLCAQSSGEPSGIGQVSGTVLDPDGQPVAGASVCTTETVAGNSSSWCRTITNDVGRFEIDDLKLGTFIVSATKEEEGYSSWKGPTRKVTLTVDRPSANVTLKLGPKAGMLVGTVKDKFSGKPLDNIQITCVGVNTNSMYSAGAVEGTFRMNLQPTTEFIVSFSSPGYRTWLYTDPADPSHPTLQLESGEQKSIDVALEPELKKTPGGH